MEELTGISTPALIAIVVFYIILLIAAVRLAKWLAKLDIKRDCEDNSNPKDKSDHKSKNKTV